MRKLKYSICCGLDVHKNVVVTLNDKKHAEHVVLNKNDVFAYLKSLGYDSSKLVKRNDN